MKKLKFAVAIKHQQVPVRLYRYHKIVEQSICFMKSKRTCGIAGKETFS